MKLYSGTLTLGVQEGYLPPMPSSMRTGGARTALHTEGRFRQLNRRNFYRGKPPDPQLTMR